MALDLKHENDGQIHLHVKGQCKNNIDFSAFVNELKILLVPFTKAV